MRLVIRHGKFAAVCLHDGLAQIKTKTKTAAVIRYFIGAAIELLKDLKKNGIIFQKVEENPSVEYVDNTYFKFPADEEVEV